MERSRSKRGYYYEQDSDSQASPPPPPRNKGRYHHGGHYGGGGNHRRGLDRRPASSSAAQKFQDSPSSVTTSFRILCPEEKSGIVIGKDGGFIEAVRQDTGAWITVHELAPGDDEFIIETADNRRREPDGRPPQHCPAQDALLMIHDRTLESGFEFDEDYEDDEYGGGWDRDRGRLVSRLVVPRGHVGCLMGKGGKIIEQMRIETKTHIRILPRDHHTPRCVSSAEEIVQIVGESNAVKKAVAIISSRLKESLHRDRGPFRGRQYSPDRYPPADDEFAHNPQNRPEELDSGYRPRNKVSSSYPSRSSALPPPELDEFPASNHTFEDIVFRIICPNDKIESMVDDSSEFLEMLRADVGVDVNFSDTVPGSADRIVIVTSDEGPNDELFPAQEALLHIQSRILDIDPGKENITTTTRLLISSSSAACLADLRKLSPANVQILAREETHGPHDCCVQIVGEIRAAREALIQVTSRLRSFLFNDASSTKESPNSEGSEQAVLTNHEMKVEGNERKPEDPIVFGNGSFEQQQEIQVQEELQQRTGLQQPSLKVLEISIPEQAVPGLVMKSGHKLAQIGEMSGAKLSLLEGRADQPGKIVQISGSAEQAERAQSLLQGFILSTL